MYIVLYGEEVGVDDYDGKMINWSTFMKMGEHASDDRVEERKKKIKPGNCATLMYTSGTTGMPKGVMISHDSINWIINNAESDGVTYPKNPRMMSYLPLSHIAGLLVDGYSSLSSGFHMYFADSSIFTKGTLIDYVK